MAFSSLDEDPKLLLEFARKLTVPGPWLSEDTRPHLVKEACTGKDNHDDGLETLGQLRDTMRWLCFARRALGGGSQEESSVPGLRGSSSAETFGTLRMSFGGCDMGSLCWSFFQH